MAQSASLLVLPISTHSDDENVSRAIAALLTQCLDEDLRLAERVERALRTTGYTALAGIEVFVNAQIVYLVGRVPTYHLKQVAQATALAMPETRQVYNDLDVIT